MAELATTHAPTQKVIRSTEYTMTPEDAHRWVQTQNARMKGPGPYFKGFYDNYLNHSCEE